MSTVRLPAADLEQWASSLLRIHDAVSQLESEMDRQALFQHTPDPAQLTRWLARLSRMADRVEDLSLQIDDRIADAGQEPASQDSAPIGPNCQRSDATVGSFHVEPTPT
jgi:hypothetical protein